MNKKVKFFLKFFSTFSIVYFPLNYFIPFFRDNKSIYEIIIQTIFVGIVVSLFMTWYTTKKSKKNEKK